MTRRFRLGALIAVLAISMTAAFATTASANPDKTSKCSNCHEGVGAAISTTLLTTVGTTATYNVSAPGADAVAVFNGSTFVATISGATGTFSVPTGGTYTLYSVTGPSELDGLGTTTVSPLAAPTDTVAPATTSNAVASYVSSAAIKLTATDAGSGVATTYYKLDAGAQTTGTAIAVSALGSHTIEFWSVDVVGNIETHKTASFTITAPVVVDATAPVTTSDAVATYVGAAAINLTATDADSGVATTYFKLDGGTQTAGKAVTTSALGSHTIEFWSVDVAGNIEAAKTAAFTITAPVPVDATAPVTTSNAVATYLSSAAIKLTATDAGSGVATTYYKLDGGTQTEGTAVAVSAPGSHTVSFWSVDAAGNIETAKTASFSITAPPVVSGMTTTTITIHASRDVKHDKYAKQDKKHGKHESKQRRHESKHDKQHKSAKRRSSSIQLSGKLMPGADHLNVSLYVMAPGSTTWSLVKIVKTDDSHKSKNAKWDYRADVKTKGSYKFQVRFAGTDAYTASVSKIVTVKVR